MDIIHPRVVVYVAYANGRSSVLRTYGSEKRRMSRKHVVFYCLQLQHQHSTMLLYNKTNRHNNFWIYFWCETLHVSGSSSTHHQELATVHSALAQVIQVWRQLACRIRMVLRSVLILHASCHQTCITCASAECTVTNSWWRVEELPETCRVSHQK